jgi:hypothetical protein
VGFLFKEYSTPLNGRIVAFKATKSGDFCRFIGLVAFKATNESEMPYLLENYRFSCSKSS